MAWADNGQGVSEVGSLSSVTTGINNEGMAVNKFQLFNAYPNPFNPKTVISYRLAVNSEVEISIFNNLGQKVTDLVSEKQTAGYYTVEWDATEFSSGIYFYQIKTDNGFREVKKLVLIK